MATSNIFRDNINGSITMASSASTSAGIDMRGYPILGLEIPTMTSGIVSFQEAADPGTGNAPVAGDYKDVHKTDGSGKFVMATGTSNLFISIDDIIAGAQWVRVVSSVLQTALRTIKFNKKG